MKEGNTMLEITKDRAKALYTIGKQMRAAQESYFRIRTTTNLRAAKDFERRFDAALKECEDKIEQLRLL